MEQNYWISLSQRAASEPPTGTNDGVDGRLSPLSVSSLMLSCSTSRTGKLERDLDSKNVHATLHTDLTLPALGGTPQTKNLPTFREISQKDGWFDSGKPQPGDGVVRFPPSLSIFNAPTATYAWPRLQPASEMYGSPVRSARYSDLNSSSPPPLYSTPSPQLGESSSSYVTTPRSPKRKAMDCESDPELPAYSDTSLNQALSYGSTRGVSVATRQFDCLRLSSRHTIPVPEGNRCPPLQALMPSRVSSASSSLGGPTYSRSSSTRADLNWEHHAVRERRNGVTVFRCRWIKDQDGKQGECGYSAQKQLVKRHIDTTHLRKKPYVCDICGKAYPQKTSLAIHRCTHTGEKPLPCEFPGCLARFSDPARRHRHLVQDHQYIPKPGKRQPRNSDGL